MKYGSPTLLTSRTPWNLPMTVGTSFLLVTVLMYWFEFPGQRQPMVLIYVLVCIYFLLIGSVTGSKLRIGRITEVTVPASWIVVTSVLLAISSTVNITTFYSSVSEIMNLILQPGTAYEHVKFLIRNGQVNEPSLGGLYGPVITMLSFTKYLLFGWTVLYWSSLPKSVRAIALSSMFYYLLQVVLIGAMVNIATVAISTLVVVSAKSSLGDKKHKRRILTLGFVFAALALILLSFFRGAREEQAVSFVDRLLIGFDGLIYYVSHGYVGLGFSFQQPFVFTNGETIFYGFSRLFTETLSPDSYLVRSQEVTGWSATQLWSTAVPWLASDITFIGVPIVLLLAGIWAGRLWKKSISNLDPFALLVLGQISIAIFFFPANNHLFQTFANASGFTLIILMYFLSYIRSRRLDEDELLRSI